MTIEQNFDEQSVGQAPTSWTLSAGGAGVISDTFYVSASRSMKIVRGGGNINVRRDDFTETSHIELEFKPEATTNSNQIFFSDSAGAHSGANLIGGLVFETDGDIGAYDGTSTVDTGYNYTTAFQKFKIVINPGGNTYS